MGLGLAAAQLQEIDLRRQQVHRAPGTHLKQLVLCIHGASQGKHNKGTSCARGHSDYASKAPLRAGN
jgi:hypothetical protein